MIFFDKKIKPSQAKNSKLRSNSRWASKRSYRFSEKFKMPEKFNIAYTDTNTD
jgi:hypothetical protein